MKLKLKAKSLLNMTMLLGVGPVSDCISCISSVAESGQAAPDAGGDIFATFATPFINGQNDVIFHARLDDENSMDEGIWAGQFGSLVKVARVGDVAPFTGGATFASISPSPAFNDGGHLAFHAVLTGSGVTSANDKAIFAQDLGGGGALRLVARTGDAAPDMPGHFFLAFDQEPLIDNDGRVQVSAYTANVLILANHWYESPGVLTRIAGPGVAADDPAGATFLEVGRPSINDVGHAAFQGVLAAGGAVNATNDQGIWIDDAGTKSLLVREGDPAPGMPNTVFAAFEPQVRINVGSAVAFIATLRDDGSGTSGINSSNDTGVWSGSILGGVTLIAREDGAFANFDGLRFGVPLAPVLINDNSDVALRGSVRGPGIDSTNDDAVFSDVSGAVRALAREGTAVPAGTGVFVSFEEPVVNAIGQVAFMAALADGSDLEDALLVTSVCTDLCIVAREGDQLSPVPDGPAPVENIHFRGGSGNGDGQRSGLSDTGDISATLDFSDGERGVFEAIVANSPCIGPLNDRCVYAEEVAVPGQATGTTAGANADLIGSCGVAVTAPGVWYSVEGTGHTLTVSTCDAAEFDTKISVFCDGCPDAQTADSTCCSDQGVPGCDDSACMATVCAADIFCCDNRWDSICASAATALCGTLCLPVGDVVGATCIGGADDTGGCGDGTTEFSWCAQAGTTYTVLVHGADAQTGGFTLTVSESPDACTGAIPCGAATGACCSGDACTETTALACAGTGGTFRSEGALCSDYPCERSHPGWNSVDVGIELTSNQPTYWSAATGQPATGGVAPFTILDPGNAALGHLPGRPATDGSGERVLRGFIVAWAVNADGAEIRWNHLSGDAVIVNYARGTAWEYASNAFQVVALSANGEANPPPAGELFLDGEEYDNGYDLLLLDFYATGSDPFGTGNALLDSELTLMPLELDLRQETAGPVTSKASFTIWNQNETKLTGLDRCVTCWDSTLFRLYGNPNHLLAENLQTDKGKAQIDGLPSQLCDFDFDRGDGLSLGADPRDVVSSAASLIGVVSKQIAFGTSGPFEAAGMNLVGMGTESGLLQADISGGAPPERPQRDAMGVKPITVRRDGVESVSAYNPPVVRAPSDRVSISDKGSLLIYPKVELRWDASGDVLIQDTFIDLANDFPADVQLQMYFVNGDPPTP